MTANEASFDTENAGSIADFITELKARIAGLVGLLNDATTCRDPDEVLQYVFVCVQVLLLDF